MMQDFLFSLIQWLLGGMALAMITRWISNSLRRPRPATHRDMLYYPKSILIVGISTLVFFTAVAIISNTIGKNETTSIWTTLVFVGFALLSLPLIAGYFFNRHRLTHTGMESFDTFGRRTIFPWTEVRHVRYSGMGYFILDLNTRKTIRISSMLMGLPEFALALLTHVPASAIESEAHALLRAMTRDQPPDCL